MLLEQCEKFKHENICLDLGAKSQSEYSKEEASISHPEKKNFLKTNFVNSSFPVGLTFKQFSK